MRRRSKLSLVLAAVFTLWGAGCEEPCRYDLDCGTEAGLTRCNVDTGQCEPLVPMTPPSCDGPADCEGGRVCVASECRFAPSCQSVIQGASFDYIARCSDGAVTAGTATATTNGCKVELTLAAFSGQPVSLILDPISATADDDVEITTSSDSAVTCPAGLWSAPYSAASLPSCQMPGGLTCDLGIARVGTGPVCLADGTGCAATEVCEPFVPDTATAVGGCR